jgi:enamine deaminase RidA (YjgF/YER057c/UK114 family)
VIEYINPSTLYRFERHSQATVSAGTKHVHTAGQVAIDPTGALVGEEGQDYRVQAAQATRNLFLALEAAGARPDDVATMTVYLVDPTGNNLDEFREGFREARTAAGAKPCALTVVGVPALALPGAVVEINATAILD